MRLAEALIDQSRPWQFRGKGRLLDPFVPRSGVRQARVHGYQMELDLSEHIQRTVYLGAYERHETRLVSRLLRPGMCFVDVGANVGYFTLLAARRVGPTGRVVAVEPSRYAADRLTATVSANGIRTVRLAQIGLGREPGTAVLYDPLPDNHSPSMHGSPGAAGEAVPVRRLDDCLTDWGVDRVDLLKIDVEGSEPAVLDGASAALAAGRIRAVLCEFNEVWLKQAGTTAVELHAKLLGHGFRDATDTPWDPAAQVQNRLLVATG